MRSLILSAAMLMASVVPAMAQDASVRSGQILVSSDGRSMGKISRVINDASGAPSAATIIVDTRFVKVPVSTLTVEDNRAKSSLSRAEIRKLK